LRPEMRISNQVVSNAHKVTSQNELLREGGSKVQYTTKTWESRIYSHIDTLQCEMLQKGWKQYLTSQRSFPYKMQCTLRERREDEINFLSICIIQLEEINIHLLDVVDHVAQLLYLFIYGLYIISNLLSADWNHYRVVVGHQ